MRRRYGNSSRIGQRVGGDRAAGHEYGEVIKDQFSDYGHLHLIIKQAEKLGLTPQQVIATKPTVTTKATLYAWGWLTHAYRMGQRWVDQLGLTWDDLPNWKAHREADKGHVDMFLPVWEEYGKGENEKLILEAAKESEQLYRVYQAGLADVMVAVN